MIEIRELLVTSIDKLVASGAIEKAMEEAIAKTVVEVLKSQLREYSDFGKQLTKAVEKSLAIHGEIDLPAYNHAILKIIERQVELSSRQSIEREVAQRMKELLTPAPERIALSTLVEQYVQHLKDKHEGGCTCYGDGRAYVDLRASKDAGNFYDLILAESREKPSSYSARAGQISVGIHISKSEDGEPKAGKIYHLAFSNADVEKQMFVGPIRNFERSIFQMKAANTQLELDCDPSECDVAYAHAHD